jgi:hypothetical protein
MKKIIISTLLICLGLFLGACDFTPQSKSSYFEKYEAFLEEVKLHKGEISAEQWIEYDKQHDLYSVDYFQKFKDKMILEEKANARKLGASYQILRTKAKIKDILPFGKKDKK